MIIVDGIIYSLQSHGGITVYFNELLQRAYLHRVACTTMVYDGASSHASGLSGNIVKMKNRYFERFRYCQVPNEASLFHSSYYRLPDRSIPTVTTVHDFTYERFVKGPRRLLHSWQKFNAIRKSQAIICISENTRNDLLHFLPDVPTERLHVVHNGVGDSFFPLDLSSDSEKDRPFVLFVGARGGYKNFSLVVEALARVPELGLVCVGGGPLNTNEMNLVVRYLGGKYHHLSDISDRELNNLYNRAYCLVYPSAYEGFGIPILEAMKAGCPVIAFNGSSVPEVAGDAAFLLSQLKIDDLEGAFHKLEDHECRLNFIKKGLYRSNLFTWEKTFKETQKVYDLVRGVGLINDDAKF